MRKHNYFRLIFQYISEMLLALLCLVPLKTSAQEVIEMRKESNGLYTIPCSVNGLRLRFILDTGASNVSLSVTEANFMLKNDYLESSDVTGTTNTLTADGEIKENYTVNIRSLQIGSIVLHNVPAVVSKGLSAPLLLGQSVLSQLGQWSIKDSQLILNDYESTDSTVVEADNVATYDELLTELDKELGKGFNQDAYSQVESLMNEGNLRAARIFLKYASPGLSKEYLTKDSEINHALQAISSIDGIDINDITWNYTTLIEFYLCRLNSVEKALSAIKNIENNDSIKSIDFSFNYYDELIYDAMLQVGWGHGRFDKAIADYCLQKGYYKTYNLYGHFLAENENELKFAFMVYKKCSEAGYGPSLVDLAICYLDGKGTDANRNIGLSLLERAANNGEYEAVTELCSRYFYGNGVNKDYNKVLKYAKLYGDCGENKFIRLAYEGVAYYEQKDYRFAFQSFKDLDLISDEWTKNHYIALNNGINRIYDDVLADLGQCYENGLSCPVNVDLAFQCYKRVIDINPGYGNALLGDLFLSDNVEKNPEVAYQYYLAGANNGNSYCYFRLALMNLYGVGTEQNSTKAKQYKMKAIESGDYSSTDFDF